MTSPDEMTASLPLIKRMARVYIRPRVGKLGIALFLMLISAAMTGAMAKLMEPIIDKAFSGNDADSLVTIAAMVMAAFTVRGFAAYGHTLLLNRIGQGVVSDIQRDMFGHLVKADLAWLHSQGSGQLLSRFISDTAFIRTAVTESLVGVGKNFFTLIALIGVMFYQDWKLSIISLFVFPAAAYVVMRLSKKLRGVSTSMQHETGELTAALGQAFQGNKHIKSYGTEAFEKNRVNMLIANITRLMNKTFRTSGMAQPMSEILSGLAIVTIIIYGGVQVAEGASTAGKLFSFITAFMLAFEPMKRLAKLNNIMQMGLASADRLFKMIDVKPVIEDKADAITLAVQSPVVAFDNVTFTYADGTVALQNISFTAPAGKTIALVGESGAGKSTILNLIPRFYDVNGGAIHIDDHDVRDVTIQSLRANMALVSQEVAIFNDTIRDNICYGTENPTEDKMIEAAKLAAAHDFILELPQGYDTRVGENGVKLSGGQRQRISIARAMMKDAPILLLDEATSALDTNSERLVQMALERLQKGRTTIVVAHRLSTIMNADTIYVMKNGAIAETGTHDVLLGKGGIYARLYGSLLKESA